MGWFKNTKVFAAGGEGGNQNGQHPGQRPGDIPTWEERFEYDISSEIFAPDGNYYRCIENHVASNSFATDLAAAKWTIFGGPGINTDDQTLAEVLVEGNTTGLNDVIVNAGQKITTDNATTGDRYEIEFISSGFGADQIVIARNTGDGGGMLVGQFASVMSLIKNGGTRQFNFEVGTNDHFRFSDSGGAPTLNLVNGADGLLSPDSLTANRSWLLQDKSGTIALLSDIPGAEDLAATLAEGFITGPNPIHVSGGQNVSLLDGFGSVKGFFKQADVSSDATAFRNVAMPIYLEATAGDEFVLQLLNTDSSDDAIVRSSIFYMQYLHD